MADEFEQIEIASREELRAWLSAHHEERRSVWLVTWKKAAGAKHLSYDEIVEEALCFGWIDSRTRSLDTLRSMRLLSPRKAGSAWSRENKARAMRMLKAGRMTQAGRLKIEAAQRDGSWLFLEDVQGGKVPEDLAAAMARYAGAAAHFDAFPPSSKRIVLEWIKQAKRPETRAKRVEETARKAADNVRANHYR